MKAIILADCNSFYCSCERVFRPETRGRPVIVLSNNDGCAIAFTNEAKAIGLGDMCAPYFQIKDIIKKHKVAVFSSNYALYDDMSRRVMGILNSFCSEMEIYSVDEAFLEFENFESEKLLDYSHEMRREILKSTGLPVGFGISTTKVLAKLANKLSRSHDGVMLMIRDEDIDRALKQTPVKKIWGIGHQSALKLNMLGIKTAYEFKMFRDEKIIQKLLTKTGREIQEELRGVSCLDIEQAEDKKNMGSSRSFGIPVFEKKELREALAHFTTHAVLKLRLQKSVCFSVSVFTHTNFHKDLPQYYGTGSRNFISGTSDVMKLIRATHDILEEIYRPGYEYKKAGVLLSHIVPENENQLNLLEPNVDDNSKLNEVLDIINKKYGPYTIKSAACGTKHTWRTIADYKSNRYTTSWKELLKV